MIINIRNKKYQSRGSGEMCKKTKSWWNFNEMMEHNSFAISSKILGNEVYKN